ncbi:hypothetical protein [Paraburkholderia caledonica]|uniref:Chemotaxis protein n=1 Tax=Paraburkholderia caledonica TaxID=134536 RepID=A0ABU1KZ68_9BURK|nr:hypothetical protein [Paraburkholderia caledonica]MDR6376197.1 hypothetical protein [Paraburkholderia caledonica]
MHDSHTLIEQIRRSSELNSRLSRLVKLHPTLFQLSKFTTSELKRINEMTTRFPFASAAGPLYETAASYRSLEADINGLLQLVNTAISGLRAVTDAGLTLIPVQGKRAAKFEEANSKMDRDIFRIEDQVTALISVVTSTADPIDRLMEALERK